jgi:hypothetical protein
MVTNIQSTQLDFANIKNSLKTYLAQQPEFADYNFEASGLSNILDVLAYNTHYNGLIANFALNEAFLNTAQLRSSVVSHAEALGYNPRSVTSAVAYLSISVTITASGRPTTITLPKYSRFTSSVDDINYSFYTLEDYTASDDGSGYYQFVNSSGIALIPVVEGTLKTKTFYVGSSEDRQIYVIPDATLDSNTVTVDVYTSPTSSDYVSYTSLYEVITIDAGSRVYQLRETPNGYFELSFSDGITIGAKPIAGNKIVVTYLSSNGANPNGASGYSPVGSLTVNSVPYNISAVTINAAAGGTGKESIESIRVNAPIKFAAQQRLVTSEDYKALILTNFPQIQDCIAWGGEENLPNPEYGKVFVSLKFPDVFPESAKGTVKNAIQTNLIKPLSVMSISTEFVDPVITYLECSIFFTFNPNKTNVTLKTTETNVSNTIQSYFANKLNVFGESFRRSNVLTDVDDLSEAILDSRMDVKVQQRFVPLFSATSSYTTVFPIALAAPDDVNYVITSNQFTYNNKICNIRNRLLSTSLEVVDTDGNVQLNDVGNYNPNNGIVKLIGFSLNSIVGGLGYIRLSAVPANPSTITPLRNYILNIDTSRSFASGSLDYGKTQVAL